MIDKTIKKPITMQISTRIKQILHGSRALAVVALIAAACLPSLAEEKTMLVVILQGGQQQSYVLADRPKVTFDATNLYITNAAVEDSYEMSKVVKFVFEKGDATAITPVVAGENRITFVDGEHVVLEGLAPATSVSLLDLGGHLLGKTAADASGSASISLSSQPSGVYIVGVAGGKSYKILKR